MIQGGDFIKGDGEKFTAQMIRVKFSVESLQY
jgi:hypothetical protein